MSITSYRRITQFSFILLIFLIPVLDIFRYDSDLQELIIFGHAWSLGLKQGFYAEHTVWGALQVAVQFFLRAVLPWLLFLALFPLLGYLTGRFFCGWLCPEGALFELADYLTLRIIGRRSIYGAKPNESVVAEGGRLRFVLFALVTMIVVPLIGGISLTGYLVSPRTIFSQIVSWHFTFGVKAGIIGVALYMLITSIFVRHVLCKFVCAAGLMQMLFGWISPLSLRLRLDSSRIRECTDCRGCDRTCFMNITPRKNKRDISCVNCGACVEACDRELGSGRGLFRLGFGPPRNGTSDQCEPNRRSGPVHINIAHR